MKTKDLETLIRLEKELDILCTNIFNYVKENYHHKLIFGIDSFFCGNFLREDGLNIKYYNYGEIMSYAYLSPIPLKLLEDESLWKQFIDDCYSK